MDKLLGILKGMKPHLDFEKEVHLIDDGLLDSFDIVVLVGQLNDEFSINISVAQLKPEHFNSAEAMLKLIESLRR